MSKQTIAEKAQVIRNETQQYGNTRGRVADILDDINETKADKVDLDSAINQNLVPLQEALAQEIFDRKNGDQNINQSLSTEVQNRKDADSSLQGQIDTNKTNIGNLQTGKLDKTTTTVSAPDGVNKYVYLMPDDNSAPVRMLAGDLGKNMANSDLTSTAVRYFKQAYSYTWDTAGFPYNIKGLSDKSNDTTFSRILTEDASGQVAFSSNSALMVNGMKAMQDWQKDALRAASLKTNEKYSTSQPRVDALLPPLIDLSSSSSSSSSSITAVGVNLFVNTVDKVAKVETIDLETMQVIETIENIVVHQTIPTQMSFDINKALYTPDKDYGLRVTHNGLVSIINKNAYFRVVSQITQQPVDMQWELINHNRTEGDINVGSFKYSSNANSFTIEHFGLRGSVIENGIVNVLSNKDLDSSKGYLFDCTLVEEVRSSGGFQALVKFKNKEDVDKSINVLDNVDGWLEYLLNYNIGADNVTFNNSIFFRGYRVDTPQLATVKFTVMIKGNVLKLIYNNMVFIQNLVLGRLGLKQMFFNFLYPSNTIGSVELNKRYHKSTFTVLNILEF